LIKKNCEVIKNIKGRISNIIEGEFNKDKKTGYKMCVLSIPLKNSNSSNIPIITIKQKNTLITLINDFKNKPIRNLE
tara:strand:- start:947 stop:1177 length:231 start_codon:yes stop_codon:yes gene_type:complete